MTSPNSDVVAGDRSVPRARVASGDRSIDRRGRSLSAPAILSYGFRPFFLGASLYAAASVPLWLWMYLSGTTPGGPFAGTAWHAHEMIFGYLAAVMAGFVLTAVPNWTGRLPLSGAPLGVLFALWLAGRLAVSIDIDPMAALLIDLAFPLTLCAAVWREVAAGRNWRNAPVAVLLTLFAAANLLHHLEAMEIAAGGIAVRLALSVAALMMTLIGGRVVPSFTRNWLVKQGIARLPASFGRLDKAAMIVVAAAAAAWILAPAHPATGVVMAAAGGLLFARLSRWRGASTWREPIVLILHLGYLWLSGAFILLGLSILWPAIVPASAGLHALTAGAIGTMTLAVMTRASLGHTGHAIATDRTTLAIYSAVTAGAVLRVAAPFAPDFYGILLASGGSLWSAAFAMFALRYGPLLLGARRPL